MDGVVVAFLKVIPKHVPGGTKEKPQKNLCQASQFPGHELNLGILNTK